MNTLKFFDDVMEIEERNMLSAMATALSVCRTPENLDEELSEEGQMGLSRLMEIWSALQPSGSTLVLEGSEAEILADLLAAVFAYIIQNRASSRSPVGLALMVELRYMSDCIEMGNWHGEQYDWEQED